MARYRRPLARWPVILVDCISLVSQINGSVPATDSVRSRQSDSGCPEKSALDTRIGRFLPVTVLNQAVPSDRAERSLTLGR